MGAGSSSSSSCSWGGGGNGGGVGEETVPLYSSGNAPPAAAGRRPHGKGRKAQCRDGEKAPLPCGLESATTMKKKHGKKRAHESSSSSSSSAACVRDANEGGPRTEMKWPHAKQPRDSRA
jgi:hypothetical protein